MCMGHFRDYTCMKRFESASGDYYLVLMQPVTPEFEYVEGHFPYGSPFVINSRYAERQIKENNFVIKLLKINKNTDMFEYFVCAFNTHIFT